jgi:hypothetical protein
MLPRHLNVLYNYEKINKDSTFKLVTKPLRDPIIEETPSMVMATIFWISEPQERKKLDIT